MVLPQKYRDMQHCFTAKWNVILVKCYKCCILTAATFHFDVWLFSSVKLLKCNVLSVKERFWVQHSFILALRAVTRISALIKEQFRSQEFYCLWLNNTRTPQSLSEVVELEKREWEGILCRHKRACVVGGDSSAPPPEVSSHAHGVSLHLD